jgi:diguanylate cyclase (GGDEF)-like protein
MAKRKKQEVGIVLLGIDRFQEVKAQIGTEDADMLLAAAADRLKRCMREVDTVARLGGDVFTCLLEAVGSKGDMEVVANRILKAMGPTLKVQDRELSLSVSLGIAVFPLDGQEPDQLLERAKDAMARAQDSGGGRYMHAMQ